MAKNKTIKDIDTTLFLEELKKRASFSQEAYEQFLLLWDYRVFKKNEFVMEAYQIPKYSVFVLKGCLRQFLVGPEGDEHIVYFAEERHWIGDLSAMRNKIPSKFNLQAIEKSELLVISAENWEKAFADFPWWTEAHIKGHQRWASTMQEQMANQLAESSENKYLKLLKEKPSLFLRVPQHYIASFLGMSPENLSRIRKKLYNT